MSSQKLMKRLLNGLKCKVRSKYVKLADAPNFCHTASLQVGSGRCSLSLCTTQMESNMIIDITQEYVKAVDMVNSWFKIQIRAKM